MTASYDQEPFEIPIRETMATLRAFAMKLCLDADMADDLVHETVAKALEKNDQFRPGTNLHAWLCIILRNHYYDQCRRRRREVDDPDSIDRAIQNTPDAVDAIYAKQALEVFEYLPPAHRDAIRDIAYGMTYAEAAEKRGAAAGTIKSRVCRGRKGFLKLLAQRDAAAVGALS